MHTHTIRTKFTFSDHVRFDTKSQCDSNLQPIPCSGTGKVFGITFVAGGDVDYMIEIDRGTYSDLIGGVTEDEMILIGDDPLSDTPTMLSSPPNGGHP